MNKKRLLLVSIGIIGILTVLGAAAFVLTSRTSAQVDAVQSDPPAALTSQQSTTNFEAQSDAYYAAKKDSSSGYADYSSDGFGCSHDSASAIDWSLED